MWYDGVASTFRTPVGYGGEASPPLFDSGPQQMVGLGATDHHADEGFADSLGQGATILDPTPLNNGPEPEITYFQHSPLD